MRTMTDNAMAAVTNTAMSALSSTMSPSPFALAESGMDRSISGEQQAQVTVVWRASVADEIRELTSLQSHITFKSIAITAQNNFLKVVASGSETALRSFLQTAALRNLAAERVVWSMA